MSWVERACVDRWLVGVGVGRLDAAAGGSRRAGRHGCGCRGWRWCRCGGHRAASVVAGSVLACWRSTVAARLRVGRDGVALPVAAGTVSTTWTSMVALPVTRSVRALPRACSMLVQVPAATRSWARLVDRGPGGGGVFAGEGAVPLVDAGLGDPPAQPGRGAGPLGALAQQLGGDAVQQHPGASPQGGGVVAEVPGQRGHDRVGHVGRCHLELERDDPGPVAVELPGRHRLVQPTQPAGLGHVAVRRPAPGPGPAASRTACSTRRWAWGCDAPITGATRSAASRLTRPGACTVSPRVPSSHQTLSRRAASAIAASCTAVRVLISDWQSPTTPSHWSRPCACARPRRALRRPGAHRPTRPRPGRSTLRWTGWRWRRDERSLRCCDVITSPPSPWFDSTGESPYRTSVRMHVFACSRIILRKPSPSQLAAAMSRRRPRSEVAAGHPTRQPGSDQRDRIGPR